jgi:outer membrane protein assembly factor BamB
VVGSPASDGRTVFFNVNVNQQGGWLEAAPVAGCGALDCSPSWRMQVGVNNAPSGSSYWYGSFGDGPLVADGLVFTGPQQKGQPLVAVRTTGCSQTCAPVWSAPLEGGVSGVPADSGGVLYVAEGPVVAAYRAAGCGATTCGPIWTTSFRGIGVVNATPAVGGGRVVTPTADGMVRCLDATTGAPLWAVQAGDSNNANGLRSSPLLAGSTVFVSHDSTLDARSLSTGALLWSAPLGFSGVAASPSGAGGLVFVSVGDQAMEAFDVAGCGASTCVARWTGSLGPPTTTTGGGNDGPVVAGGALYAPMGGLTVFSME